MKLIIQLKDNRKSLAKIDFEVSDGLRAFKTLTLHGIDALFTNNEGDKTELLKQLKESVHNQTDSLKSPGLNTETVKLKKEDAKISKPEVISDEVVVPMEEEYYEQIAKGERATSYISKENQQNIRYDGDPEKKIVLCVKCPECGEFTVYITPENTGNVFRCKCGNFEIPIQNTIPVEGECPNCSYRIKARTFPGMDISEGFICHRCGSIIDFEFDKKHNSWKTL